MMPPISMDEITEVQTMIQRLEKQVIVRKRRTQKLIEGIRKELHMLAIETEGLIAVGLKRGRSQRLVRPK